jgi:putative NADH-flavin reductase
MNKAVEGQDAIINCLGPRTLWTGDVDVCSRSQKIIIESMKFHGVRRIIVVSSQSVGGNDKQVGKIQNFFGLIFSGKFIADKEIQERHIKENSDFLDWTIVRPSKLYNGELTGHYKLNENLTLMKISRANVAHFILEELRSSFWLKKTPTINGYENI